MMRRTPLRAATRRTLLTVGAAALLLGGCAASAPEKRFLLAPAESAAEQAVWARLVGLREVSLPAYARDERIFRRGPDGALAADEAIRWADAPERFVTQHLARGIDGALSANVVAEPWPRAARPDVTVEVVFDRLLAEADGSVAAAGQLRLAREAGRGDLAIGSFNLRGAAPAATSGMARVTAAYAAALDKLAAQIAERIAALPRPRGRPRR